MKKLLIITLSIVFSIGLFAQKDVRKAVRSGNKSYKDQLYATAEAEYSKAIEKNASSKEASFNLANTFYKQQKWDDAVKEYQHYLTLENEDPKKMSSAWSNMGNTFLKKKVSEKGQTQNMMQGQAGQVPQDQPQGGQNEDPLQMSMEAYKNALRLNSEDNETRYNLAVVQKMLKDRENQDQNQDQKQDQKKDDQKKDDQKKDDQKKDPKQDDKQDKKQDQQQQNQMSQENMEQMLQAIEQDEKATQDKVSKAKAQERKKKNDDNRKQNKDW